MSNMIELLEMVAPSSQNAMTPAAHTDDEWTSIDIDDDAVFVDVSLTGGSGRIVAQSDTPADADTGCLYQANVVYRIPVRRATKLWVRNGAADTNVTPNVTEYISLYVKS